MTSASISLTFTQRELRYDPSVATKQSTADYLTDQMSGAGEIRSRKMFGEYAVYCDGKVVALICDERLFVKSTDVGRKFLGEVTEASPYPSAKPHFLVEGDRCEDRDWIAELIALTAAALPPPKRKK